MLSGPNIRLYFENPAGRVAEHANGFAIVHYSSEPRDFTDFQAFMTHVRHLLVQRAWYRVVSDQRLMVPFTDEERTWIRGNFLVRVRPDGQPLHVAVLLAHNVFARLATNLVVSEAREAQLVYRMFEQESSALIWLAELSHPVKSQP
ncbi:hypothetical protein [Hymenobacter rubripertinctus]|uniref:STAS/SEC14 domain-containing protein n=1 Tax=Hymenobacter rubripertinctus TaxID=2029981 RepID=A0A418QSH6_9BACT|nr:hypothetical protein [Hymenobacter rubripertinctus]RIY08227.1 hypothetical protein D0T11_15075 [Hymenobacter rubripertinctus]